MRSGNEHLTAGELSLELDRLGLSYSAEWVRDAWRIGAPNLRRREGRLCDMIAWMKSNPEVRPRAKRKGKRQ